MLSKEEIAEHVATLKGHAAFEKMIYENGATWASQQNAAVIEALQSEVIKWQNIAADLQAKRAGTEAELAEKNATIESLTKTIENLSQSIALTGALDSKI